MSAAYSPLSSLFKQCSKCPSAAATHDQSLLRNDTIALLMISCSKSLCIVSSTKSLLAHQCLSPLAHISNSIPALHLRHDNPLTLCIWYICCYFTSQSQLNYFFA